MQAFVDEMDLGELAFTIDGEEVTVPIMGIFNVNHRNYVVVFTESEETNEQELLLLSIHNDDDGKGDYVQLIEDKEEWELASKAWHELVNKVEKGEYRDLGFNENV